MWVIFQCREKKNIVNQCLSQYTSEEKFEESVGSEALALDVFLIVHSQWRRWPCQKFSCN